MRAAENEECSFSICDRSLSEFRKSARLAEATTIDVCDLPSLIPFDPTTMCTPDEVRGMAYPSRATSVLTGVCTGCAAGARSARC